MKLEGEFKGGWKGQTHKDKNKLIVTSEIRMPASSEIMIYSLCKTF